MKRKFIFLVNPISGTRSKTKLVNLITDRTRAADIPFEIIDTRKDGDYSFLVQKIATALVTDVIICGGDGTINQVAAALLNIPVHIGVIPMGSGNGLALAAGISTNPSKAMDIIFKGNAAAVDGFYVNKHFGCMLTGVGFDAQVAHDFATQSTRGLWTYIKQSLRLFFRYKTYSFVIEINGEKISTEAFFISIANSNQFGNHVTIAPRASLHDGLLDVIVVNKKNKYFTALSLLRHIKLGKVKQPVGQKGHTAAIDYWQTTNIKIENPSMAPLHIDGEPAVTDRTIEVNIIPAAIKLLQP
jgi:YegS/Rv2252/BmrU family lipid kinase